jgi:hypothetical protein
MKKSQNSRNQGFLTFFVWCLSRIRIFPIPIRIFSHPPPGSASKNLSILTQKMGVKLSEIWSGLYISDPNLFNHPRSRIQGSKRHRIPDPDPQHQSLNVATLCVCVYWFPSPPAHVVRCKSVALGVPKMLRYCPPTCASHLAALLCTLTSPSQALVWKHPSDNCGPASIYSALHHTACKSMLVIKSNPIWMYRYILPEINILCLMSLVSQFSPCDVFVGYHEDAPASICLVYQDNALEKAKTIFLRCATPDAISRYPYFDVRSSKVSKELKVVLLHLWRVNVKATRGFCLHFIHSRIFTWIKPRHNNIINCTIIVDGPRQIYV